MLSIVQSRKSQLYRFLYLNVYALLLLFVGGGLLLLPTYLWHWAAAIPQVIVGCICIKNAIRIMRAWDAKMREYKMLMERNAHNFSPSSFARFMTAPCGRQLVKVVLRDLGRESEYKSLLQYKTPLLSFIRNEMCAKPQKGASITFFTEPDGTVKGEKRSN